MGKYANPETGYATLRTILQMQRSIGDAMGGTTTKDARIRICKIAALMAPTYVAGDTEESLRYYLSGGYDADYASEAIEALAWQALYGNNGSEAQRAASYAMRWSDEYATE